MDRVKRTLSPQNPTDRHLFLYMIDIYLQMT